MSSPKLRKLESERVFEQAVVQIRDLILSGALSPGDKLPTEAELTKQLDISRSSIREGLRVLESEGLIVVKRGTGTYVAENPFQRTIRSEYVHWLAKNEESLIQLLQVREGIEGLAASLAASIISDEAIAKLNDILEEQAALVSESVSSEEETIDKLASLDKDFHLEISLASGNNIAHEIISHIIPAYNFSNKAVLYVGGREKRMVEEHKKIFDAIKNGDSKAAETAMRAHINRVISEISTPPFKVDNSLDNQTETSS